MSQVSMQSRPASASNQHNWGPLPNGLNDPSHAVPLAGLNPSPWQQTPTAQWGLQPPQPGMSGLDLRAIMLEEQQAALQSRAPVSHNAIGLNSTRDGSSRHDSANAFLMSTDVSIQFPGLAQQAQQQPQQQQRSGGFYMRNKRDDSVPVQQNWAQVTTWIINRSMFVLDKGQRLRGRPRSSFNDVVLRDCQQCHINRPFRDASG